MDGPTSRDPQLRGYGMVLGDKRVETGEVPKTTRRILRVEKRGDSASGSDVLVAGRRRRNFPSSLHCTIVCPVTPSARQAQNPPCDSRGLGTTDPPNWACNTTLCRPTPARGATSGKSNAIRRSRSAAPANGLTLSAAMPSPRRRFAAGTSRSSKSGSAICKLLTMR